jgi:hypothetical protein
MWEMKRIGKVVFPQAIQGVKMAFHNRKADAAVGSGSSWVMQASVKSYCNLAACFGKQIAIKPRCRIGCPRFLQMIILLLVFGSPVLRWRSPNRGYGNQCR